MPLSALNVLVFEDSPADVLFLREALAHDALSAFELRVVERLSDGWPLLKSGGCDVVLLDLGLPDSQGLATFERVHAAAPAVPIVICSGNTDEQDAILAVRAGAQDYVVKGPVGFAMTGRAIRHAIERHKLSQSLQVSEHRFATVFHASPAAQAITAMDNEQLVDVNEAYCRLTGYARAELIGHTTHDLHFLTDPADRQAMIRRWQTDGSVRDIEFKLQTRSGEVRVALASFAPIDLSGRPCIISTVVDITERKRAEEALRISEERHRQVTSRISDYVYSGHVRPDGSATTDWISGAFERITGYTPEEINQLPMGFASLVLPEDLAPIVTRQPVLREQRTSTVEYRLRCKDGSLRWLRDYIQIEPGTESAQDLHLIGAVQDITERKQAEDKLRESEARFSTIFRSSPISIILTRIADGCIIDANAALLNLFGYERDEVLGRTTTELGMFAQPGDRAHLISVLSEHGRLEDIEMCYRKRSGEIGELLLAAERLDLAGENYLVCMLSDITARKRAEAALEQTRDTLAQAQKIAQLGSFEYITATQTTVWSEQEYRIYGLDPVEPSPAYAVMLEKFIHPDDAALLNEAFTHALQSRSIYELEHRIVRPDGSVRWVYDRAHPYFDGQGELERFIGTTLDITARKQAAAEINQLYAQLEERVTLRTRELAQANAALAAAVDRLQDLDRLKSKFVSDVSHELRTPITSLSLYIDLLEHGKPEKRDLYVSKLKEQMARLHKLINDILDMSRLERDTDGTGRSPIDLNSIAEHVSTMERGAAEAAGLTLACEVADHLPPIVARPDQLTRAITNLVSNAIKYTAAGSMRVQTRLADKRVCVEVIDTGPGIPADELPHVFERFYRGKAVAQSTIPGTGLGLAIVKDIIESHGGTVEVESVMGQGSTFRVWLPAAG